MINLVVGKKILIILCIFIFLLNNPFALTPDNYIEQLAEAKCSQFSVNDCESAQNKNLEIDGKPFNCVINQENGRCSADIYLQFYSNKETLNSFLLSTLTLSLIIGVLMFIGNKIYVKTKNKALLSNKKIIVITIAIAILLILWKFITDIYTAIQV